MPARKHILRNIDVSASLIIVIEPQQATSLAHVRLRSQLLQSALANSWHVELVELHMKVHNILGSTNAVRSWQHTAKSKDQKDPNGNDLRRPFFSCDELSKCRYCHFFLTTWHRLIFQCFFSLNVYRSMFLLEVNGGDAPLTLHQQEQIALLPGLQVGNCQNEPSLPTFRPLSVSCCFTGSHYILTVFITELSSASQHWSTLPLLKGCARVVDGGNVGGHGGGNVSCQSVGWKSALVRVQNCCYNI